MTVTEPQRRPATRLRDALRGRLLLTWLAALVAVLGLHSPSYAYTIYQGGQAYTQEQVTQFFANSSNPYLSQNASQFAAISGVESAGTFNTGVYNGSCCTGLMQINNGNLADPDICGCTRFQFAQMSGQQQINVYGKYFTKNQNDLGVRTLMQYQQEGKTLGGKPVDAYTIAACQQMGTGNCRAAIRNNCSSNARGQGGDNYTNVCGMAEKARTGKTTSNPGRNCTPAGQQSGGAGTGGGDSQAGGNGATQTSATEPCDEEQENLDKTSKTCTPTVPMLQAIPCEKYPAALQGFCRQYKPLQMTMTECKAAESYAEAAAKGARQAECESQTFGKGTSSWSYVLACSFARADQGEKGSASEGMSKLPTGPSDDPQCVNRLKEKIPDLKVLGRMTLGTHAGQECVVPSAVSTRGKAVDFGKEVTMDCSLAEKMEEFGEAVKGFGVTRLAVMGTLDCRGINNGSGTNQARLSAHGVGKAIDINGFYANGQMYKSDSYFANPANRAWFDTQLRPAACSTFTGVLGPLFYKGTSWIHYHFDVRDRTRCDTTPR